MQLRFDSFYVLQIYCIAPYKMQHYLPVLFRIFADHFILYFTVAVTKMNLLKVKRYYSVWMSWKQTEMKVPWCTMLLNVPQDNGAVQEAVCNYALARSFLATYYWVAHLSLETQV